MPYDFEVSDIIPATPEQIYDAWLSSDAHSAMTGGEAVVDPSPGGTFEAWDGYITGRNLELERPRRILQSWRTSEFADADPDSTIEVLLEADGSGTLLTLRHSGVPDGHTSYEDPGWQTQYFDPMKAYFAGR